MFHISGLILPQKMPESSSRVQLVRCPKCNLLLPELPPYSVYCCGGCGALSRAEKRSSVDDGVSEKSWEDRIGEGFERESNVGVNVGFDLGRGDDRLSKSTVRSRYWEGIRKSPIRGSDLGDFDARSKSSGRSMDRPENSSSVRSVRGGVRKSAAGDLDEERPMERNVHGYEDLEAREKVGAWFDDVKEEVEFVVQKGSVDQWLHYEASGHESELNRPRVQPRSMGFGLNSESDYDDMYSGRRVVRDDWVRGGDHGLPRQQRDFIGRDGYGMEQLRAEGNEFGGVYEHNRASRQRFPVQPNDESSNFHSYYGNDQPTQSQERFSGSSSGWGVEMNRAEQFRLYDEVRKQLGITSDLPENSNRRGYKSNFYGGFDDYVHDNLVRSGRSVESVGLDEHARMRLHHMNRNQSPSPFVNERDLDHDPSWPQYHGRIPHNRPHVQAPPDFGNRRSINSYTNPPSDFPDSYGQHTSGSGYLYSTRHNISSHSQRSVNSISDGDGSAQEHGKRVVLVEKNQLLCHPIVGAAPLVICYNCSQLLRLPKKLIAMKKTQFKLQCGSCRTTLSFDFTKKKSHTSMQTQSNHRFPIVHDVPSKIYELDDKTDLGSSLTGITNCESYNFDATGYTFPSTDSETGIQLDAQTRLGHCSSTYNAPKEDPHLDNAVNRTDASNPLMNNMPPPSDSPLQEHVDYSDDLAANKPDEKESNALGHDADARTELEINSDEIPIADMSLSSTEASSKHEGDGIIARGFHDLSPPLNSSNAKTDVFVNGQPLPYRVVRKAEKLAGPVSPGNYWYDSRAGFWGVMGNYCLGIIPPFITEFGFPMPLDCSSGDTGIYANGRELHAKDLDLLASRGLPRTRSKWYVIDISGKVQDEETGDAVVDLGKLAPSVEKAKHGFGMRPS